MLKFELEKRMHWVWLVVNVSVWWVGFRCRKGLLISAQVEVLSAWEYWLGYEMAGCSGWLHPRKWHNPWRDCNGAACGCWDNCCISDMLLLNTQLCSVRRFYFLPVVQTFRTPCDQW